MHTLITEYLSLIGYCNAAHKTKNLVVVKTPTSDRIKSINHITNEIGGIYYSTPNYMSSLGFIQYNNTKIVVKPAEKQGDGSAGKFNEQFLINKLYEFIIPNPNGKILFQSNKQSILIEDISGIKDVSKIVNKKRHKTDLKIYTNNNHFNISVKKQNAEIWESADSYAGKLAKLYIDHLLEKDLITMNLVNGVNVVYPNIAIECSSEEAESVIFGSDIDECGAIVINTFTEDDFSVVNDVLVVNCSQIIRTIDDLNEYQKPYFLIRNDCTRHCGYKGIRVLACYKSRINENILKIPIESRID